MKTARIGERHPVRREVASIKTYWENLSDAIGTIRSHLVDNGFDLDDQFVMNMQGDDGQTVVPIITDKESGVVCSCCDKPAEVNNRLVFTWYKMQSGRWEVTTYIS